MKDKVLKNSRGEIVKREPHSLFCVECRSWIVTDEKHNAFASIDGVKQRVTPWRCPGCRGEASPETVEKAAAPKSEADVSKDERLGPYREVAAVVKVNPGGKTCRVTLKVCAHEACVNVGSKGVRCRRCVPKALKGFHNRHED